MQQTVELRIGDQNAAIRYLGEVQCRPLDPIHEPIQNLLDADAKTVQIILDQKKHQIRIRGNATPITTQNEATRILQAICKSSKQGKLGEKGIGMLSFVNAGEWMVTKSQSNAKHVWFKLHRNCLAHGDVGSEVRAESFLPWPGTEITLGGIPNQYFKSRYSEKRVRTGVRKRWLLFIRKGIRFSVNGSYLSANDDLLTGEPYERRLRVQTPDGKKHIKVDLKILKEPSDSAFVSVTHKDQANFDMSSVPLFSDSVFTLGWLHGAISGDIAALNASRTAFAETKDFELWQEKIMELHDELEQIISEKSVKTARDRDQATIDEFMDHLKKVFAGTELSSVTTVCGDGNESGWGETIQREGWPSSTNGQASGGNVEATEHRGGPGRLPTVPHGGFGEYAPGIRVKRERKAFRINVKHPDFIIAQKRAGKRRRYIREICMHEAFIYSLDHSTRKQMEELSDEFMGYWTRAFVESVS